MFGNVIIGSGGSYSMAITRARVVAVLFMIALV
jgi:hypothetical protein